MKTWCVFAAQMQEMGTIFQKKSLDMVTTQFFILYKQVTLVLPMKIIAILALNLSKKTHHYFRRKIFNFAKI